MPYCRECGNKIEEDAKFCPYCGTAVSVNSNPYAQRKQEYVGKVYKCPNCGQELKSFEAKCPTCGYEMRGAKATSSVQELARRIQQIEAGREFEKKPGFFSRMSNTYSPHLSKADQQIINVIQSFPIPNTIEDILEFIILASSNIVMSAYDSSNSAATTYATKQISDAWEAKCEQAYQKAKLSFRDTPQFNEVENIYVKTEKQIKWQKRKIWVWVGGVFGVLIAVLIIVIIVTTIQRATNPNYDIDQKDSHLAYVEEKIENDIASGKFEDARNKAYTLVFDEELSTERAEYWDKRREKILSRIDEADAASSNK